jgi:hypothetical protein
LVHIPEFAPQNPLLSLSSILLSVFDMFPDTAKEQLFLLKQMEGLKEAISNPQLWAHGLRTINTDR